MYKLAKESGGPAAVQEQRNDCFKKCKSSRSGGTLTVVIALISTGEQ